ncbi:MAG: magnesium transporter CorA family protein, partial [Candidatus Pacebacteria bacterium]|nr:magnesium transporter CorA family protein [Candidatus Paceibacterota bacterium]
YRKKLNDLQVKKIKKTEKGSWISVVEPSEKETRLLAKSLNLDFTIFEDGLDENEIPRIEKDKTGNFYMIMRFPIKDDSNDIITRPILVVITRDNIVTLCKVKNNITDNFITRRSDFCTTHKTNFLLKIILEIFGSYDLYLSRILKDIKSKKIKISNLENKDILFLVQEEETLNNFVSSLFPAINILEKILSGRYITIYEKDKDIMEDLVMDSNQTLELSKAGSKSIKNIREAYSAILTNELNKVIKILTVVTIFLTIPTIVSSIFGMNVSLPLEESPLAFLFIIIIIALLSVLFFTIIKKKRWI